ncbi:MAG TPA: hypothetical protein VF324_03595 [Methanobacterium sp.]
MNRIVKIVGFGFLIWLVPFIVSLIIYPLKISFNPLFESIMPVVITLTVVLIAVFYFKDVDTKFLNEGIKIGFSWFIISILIDLILLMPSSPMQMSFTNYMMDIGLTYLIIPIVTVGMGYMVDKHIN